MKNRIHRKLKKKLKLKIIFSRKVRTNELKYIRKKLKNIFPEQFI